MPPPNFPPMSRGPGAFMGQRGAMGFPQMSRNFMPQAQAGLQSGSRGLLSRLFQRQGASQAMNAAAGFTRAAETGSIMEGLANPGKIQSFLSNTQQVIKTAQQIGPMVQQYGPLVRNLPAMWKMYKSFKSSDSDSSDSGETESAAEESNNHNADHADESSSRHESSRTANRSSTKKTASAKQPLKKSGPGQSVPKLYIPQ